MHVCYSNSAVYAYVAFKSKPGLCFMSGCVYINEIPPESFYCTQLTDLLRLIIQVAKHIQTHTHAHNSSAPWQNSLALSRNLSYKRQFFLRQETVSLGWVQWALKGESVKESKRETVHNQLTVSWRLENFSTGSEGADRDVYAWDTEIMRKENKDKRRTVRMRAG